EDQSCSRFQSRHRISPRFRPRHLSRQTEIQSCRLRLHHLHRQQRSSARTHRHRHQGKQPRRRRRPQRQSQLRRPHPSARPRQLSRYAPAGRMDLDLTSEPLGCDHNGRPVYLREIWPSPQEIESTVRAAVSTQQFEKEYAAVYEGDAQWKCMPVPAGDLYQWDPKSTYIKMPPYFENMPKTPPPLADISGARVLAVLGDSITTDHISPAGSIAVDSP